jgi:uncharacterized cofD-like protein
MRLRQLNIGCFGGGTGLPSLLGGLKRNPWLRLNAVVTTFDSGGSSGQLRDELGVLPPGDVLRCALALARNEGEARRVLLSRLPMLFEHKKLGGHTGGNLLLSMMETYSGDFLAAVDGLRALLGCQGRVWPVSVSRSALTARHADGHVSRGEVEVDAWQAAGHAIEDIWLEPAAPIHPAVGDAVRDFDAVLIGPGSFFTSLMPTLLVDGVRDAMSAMPGPVIVVSNLLTEGLGMQDFTAGDGVRWVEQTIGRPVDLLVFNTAKMPPALLASYAREHKQPLALGTLPAHTTLVEAPLWTKEIARHDRRRLSHAVWSVLTSRVLDPR